MRDAANADGTVDLGTTTGRFKDLYLSGGVYLGGTGAANKLDDYEEGTFDPTLFGSVASGSPTYSSRSASYTRVGNLVTLWINVEVTAFSGATGDLRIGGFPFTSSKQSVGSIMLSNLNWNSGTFVTPYIGTGETSVRLFLLADDATWASQAPTNEAQSYYVTLTYQSN
jgi:hypothetical protein